MNKLLPLLVVTALSLAKAQLPTHHSKHPQFTMAQWNELTGYPSEAVLEMKEAGIDAERLICFYIFKCEGKPEAKKVLVINRVGKTFFAEISEKLATRQNWSWKTIKPEETYLLVIYYVKTDGEKSLLAYMLIDNTVVTKFGLKTDLDLGPIN